MYRPGDVVEVTLESLGYCWLVLVKEFKFETIYGDAYEIDEERSTNLRFWIYNTDYTFQVRSTEDWAITIMRGKYVPSR